jgi:hypothetical protein
MRRLVMALLAGTLSLGVGGAARADAPDEGEKGHPQSTHESVKEAQLPAAVRATLEHEAQGGKIEEIKKQTHADRTVSYEAEIVKDGKGSEVEVSGKGMLLRREAPHDEGSEAEHHDK